MVRDICLRNVMLIRCKPYQFETFKCTTMCHCSPGSYFLIQVAYFCLRSCQKSACTIFEVLGIIR